MTRIAALVSFWNEAPRLPRLLASLRGHVDAAYLLDGAYAGMPGATTRSSDGSWTVIGAAMREDDALVGLPIRASSPPRLLASEMEKRTALLAMLKPGEWGLVVDADEAYRHEHHHHLGALLAELESRAVRVARIQVGGPLESTAWRPRLLRKTAGLRYSSRHFVLEDDAGPIGQDSAVCVTGPRVDHWPRRLEDPVYAAGRRVYDEQVRPRIEVA